MFKNRNIFMFKNIYLCSKIYIYAQKYKFNLKNIYLFQKKIYLCSKIFVYVQKIYIYVPKNLQELEHPPVSHAALSISDTTHVRTDDLSYFILPITASTYNAEFLSLGPHTHTHTHWVLYPK